MGNKEQFENYKTNEVTVDDIINMMVEALENDEDIVESDKTLHASPYGRQHYYNSWPVAKNYIDPSLILRKLISPYGLSGYYGYGGYGHGHGGYGHGHGGYGHDNGGYGHGNGGYGHDNSGYGHGSGGYGGDHSHTEYSGPSYGHQGHSAGYSTGPSHGYKGYGGWD